MRPRASNRTTPPGRIYAEFTDIRLRQESLGATVRHVMVLHQASEDMLFTTAKCADVGDYILDLIVLERSPPGWHQG
jgi:hypothetical protein